MLLRSILIIFLVFGVGVALGGVEEWVARYDGLGNDRDYAKDIVADAAGNVYVTGYSIHSSYPDYEYATVKYDPHGNEVWVAHYKGSDNWDIPYAITLDDSGNVYATGLSNGHHGDYATVKYDPEGTELWVARYSSPGDYEDGATDIAVDSEGNIYVTGYSPGYGTSNDYVTMKYDPDGNEVWLARYDGPGHGPDNPVAILVDSQGIVYVTGSSYGDGTDYDYATVKYDAQTGEELAVWRFDYMGSEEDRPTAAALDVNGDLYVTGYSWCGWGFVRFDIVTVIYSGQGQEQTVLRYHGPYGDDFANAIAVSRPDCFYLAGKTESSRGDFDYIAIKYNYRDPPGEWIHLEHTYNGPKSELDAAVDVGVSQSGEVYVTGYTTGRFRTSLDYTTIKYDQDFQQVWVVEYNGPASDVDEPTGLAVNAQGNAFVTGGSSSVAGFEGFDFATIKYPAVVVDLEVWVEPLDTAFRAPSDTVSFDLWVANHTERAVPVWGAVQGCADSCGGEIILGPDCHRLSRSLAPSDTLYHCVDIVVSYREGYERVGVQILVGAQKRSWISNACFELRIEPPVGTYPGCESTFEVVNWCSEQTGPPRDDGHLREISEVSCSYPNPFNISTTISYDLPAPAHAVLEVYNLLGEKVATLVDGFREAGHHSAIWNGEGCPSGVYFYNLTVGDHTATHKMLLLK